MKHIIQITTALVFLAGFILCIADKASVIGLPQYAFNLIYICFIIPGCIAASGIIKKLRPEL